MKMRKMSIVDGKIAKIRDLMDFVACLRYTQRRSALPSSPASPNTMKLHSSTTQQYQTVTGYDDSGVEINAQRFDYSLIVLPETPPRPWDVPDFEALTPAHFELIEQDLPDVVILGTGERQRFVHPRLMASFAARRVGVEGMDNKAACRTYNLLMGEGRKVTLALILGNGR